MHLERTFVELVDADGNSVGSATVADAHSAPGQKHRAFSVLLHDGAGRVLLQQRAAVKTRFPLRWANTCCGHPAPGERPPISAARRLTEELGIAAPEFTDVGVYSYRALDQVTGRVEDEYDHVLIGLYAGADPRPEPSEVADWRWVEIAEINPGAEEYAPWLWGVLKLAAPFISPRR
ncbi:MAG: isopentenyl-diphosphate Delta-isomerase [Longispora sp.]|nr:isopentenyl-diphosphate Delta-isomerase [Longispora sp. (in: high G+C Gram-positive bacteria)]